MKRNSEGVRDGFLNRQKPKQRPSVRRNRPINGGGGSSRLAYDSSRLEPSRLSRTIEPPEPPAWWNILEPGEPNRGSARLEPLTTLVTDQKAGRT